jgi:hypothetical protein
MRDYIVRSRLMRFGGEPRRATAGRLDDETDQLILPPAEILGGCGRLHWPELDPHSAVVAAVLVSVLCL